MTERRRDRRYAREGVTLKLTDGMKADTVNISSRGLYCVTDQSIPEFSKLRVAIELPLSDGDRYKIECDGVVVRAEPHKAGARKSYSLAIYFLNLDSDRAAAIDDFLNCSGEPH